MSPCHRGTLASSTRLPVAGRRGGTAKDEREGGPMDDDKKQRCLESAEHWERIATENESMAAWDRDHGIDLSAPGASAGDYRAAMYRKTASTLRLEAETGEPHCQCHERPSRDCPHGGKGLRI